MNRNEIQELINNLQDRELVEQSLLERLGETKHAIDIIDDLESYIWG